MLAALSCQLKGASEIYVIDSVPERLDKVKSIGATPINFKFGSSVEQILDLRKHNKNRIGAMRPGDETMPGVRCGIDAVGYQSHDEGKPDLERPN